MDAAGAGHGTADLFVYQNRSFLDQIAGIEKLPPCATFREGMRGLEIAEAITASARSAGATVKVG